MDMPPIPPNCPEFFKDEGYWYFKAPNHWHGVLLNDPMSEEGTWLVEHEAPWKRIIAAVARCAWLDEVERISRGIGGDTVRIILENAKEMECRQNAVAWQKWGKAVDSSMKEPQ